MPKYFFTIRTGHEGTQVERAAELDDDAAALAYASELARELNPKRRLHRYQLAGEGQ
jgi:hypothetical protein